jgi:hypothetical protein
MNWKEFFRPNIPKLILSITFIILTLFLLPLIPFTVQATCQGCRSIIEYQTLFESLFSGSIYHFFGSHYIYSLVTLFVIIFVDYTIVCGIIYIYNKVKK